MYLLVALLFLSPTFSQHLFCTNRVEGGDNEAKQCDANVKFCHVTVIRSDDEIEVCEILLDFSIFQTISECDTTGFCNDKTESDCYDHLNPKHSCCCGADGYGTWCPSYSFNYVMPTTRNTRATAPPTTRSTTIAPEEGSVFVIPLICSSAVNLVQFVVIILSLGYFVRKHQQNQKENAKLPADLLKPVGNIQYKAMHGDLHKSKRLETGHSLVTKMDDYQTMAPNPTTIESKKQ